MTLQNIKGQVHAKRILDNAIKNNRVSQAYIFSGPQGVGKFTSALQFAMSLNCLAKASKRPCGKCNSCIKFLEFSHPDLTYIFPITNIKVKESGDAESKYYKDYQAFIENRKNTPWKRFYFSGNAEIRKESIEFLQKHLEFTQKEGNYRFCIIEDADQMNQNTANAFLKTLEEPPENTVIILTTTKLNSLLPTIVSRCQLIYFAPISNKEIADILVTNYMIDKSPAKIWSRISNGSVEEAIRLAMEATHDARKIMIELIEASLNCDDLSALNLFANAKERMNAELLHDVLFNVAYLIHDLVLSDTDWTLVINVDQIDLLVACKKRFNHAVEKLSDGLLYIGKLHICIDCNVNTQYILSNLYIYLKELFGSKMK